MLKVENGKFELLGTNWTVLEQTEKGYMCIADSIGDKRFGDTNDWRNSSLRIYLNEDYLAKLEEVVGKDNIVEFERDLLSLDGQTEYGTCIDKVSLITAFEYIRNRKLLPNTYDWFWTVTADSTLCNNDDVWVRVVSPSGDVDYDGHCSRIRGVRPVCIFSSAIFESEE